MQTHLQTTYLRQLPTWCSLHGWLNRFDRGFYLAFADHLALNVLRNSQFNSSMKKSWAKDGQTHLWLMLTMLTDLFVSNHMPCIACIAMLFYHWGFVVELRQAGHAHHPSNKNPSQFSICHGISSSQVTEWSQSNQEQSRKSCHRASPDQVLQ